MNGRNRLALALGALLCAPAAFADIVPVGSSAQFGFNVASVTLSEPAGIQEGDFRLAVCSTAQNSDGTWSASGWTKLTEIASSGGSVRDVAIFHSFRGSSAGNLTFSYSGTNSPLRCAIFAARGVDTDTAFDVTFSQGDHYANVQDNPNGANPAITTVTDGALVLIIQARAGDTATGATAPSGFTMSVNQTGGNPELNLAYAAAPTAGTVAPGAWSIADADFADSSKITLALRPAPPPPTPYPAALFENGENGVWIDISDLSTLFQDDAGTTPVTSPGQPVGLILDKSGNDNHFVQASAGNRPTLQQDEHGRYYLEFDGTNDLLSTAAATWGEQVSFFALARVEGAGGANQVLLQTNTDANRPSVRLHFDTDSKYSATLLGSGGNNRWQSEAHLPPHEALITAVVDTTAQSAAAIWPVYRINGADAKDNQMNAAVVTGSLGGAMHIGARASATQAFEGRLYGLVVVDKLADSTDIAGVEAYLGPAIQPPPPPDPEFLTDPALDEAQEDGATFTFTADSAGDTIFGRLRHPTAAAWTCEALAEGTPQDGVVSKQTISGADELFVPAIQDPEFPVYSADFCIVDGDGNESDVKSVTGVELPAPGGFQWVELAAVGMGSPCDVFNTATDPDIAANDWLLAPLETTPGGDEDFELTIDAQCHFTYVGDGTRQDAIVLVHDWSAASWHLDHIWFVDNNTAPTCSYSGELVTLLLSEPRQVDFGGVCADLVDEDPITFATEDQLPDGCTLSAAGLLDCEPTTEDHAGSLITIEACDDALDCDDFEVTVYVLGTVEMPALVGLELEGEGGALDALVAAMPWRTGGEIDVTYVCEPLAMDGVVTAQIPDANESMGPFDPISLEVADSTLCKGGSRRRKLLLGGYL